jgi:hypothetical protein
MLARVSNIESFRQWREDDEQTVDDLVRWITSSVPTPAMRAGTAFHKALETAPYGEHEVLVADGHSFILPDADLVLPAIRELRGYKAYGALTVTGQVDALDGIRVDDHKTTSRFDPERYLNGCSWKFYLDIFGADVFRWNVFELKEVGTPGALLFEVKPPHTLEAYRYPGLQAECAALAADFLEFARDHLAEAA